MKGIETGDLVAKNACRPDAFRGFRIFDTTQIGQLFLYLCMQADRLEDKIEITFAGDEVDEQ